MIKKDDKANGERAKDGVGEEVISEDRWTAVNEHVRSLGY